MNSPEQPNPFESSSVTSEDIRVAEAKAFEERLAREKAIEDAVQSKSSGTIEDTPNNFVSESIDTQKIKENEDAEALEKLREEALKSYSADVGTESKPVVQETTPTPSAEIKNEEPEAKVEKEEDEKDKIIEQGSATAKALFVESAKNFVLLEQHSPKDIKEIGEVYKLAVGEVLEEKVRESTKAKCQAKGMKVMKREEFLNDPERIKKTEEAVDKEMQLKKLAEYIDAKWAELPEEEKKKYRNIKDLDGKESYKNSYFSSIEKWTTEAVDQLGIKEELEKQGAVISPALACEIWNMGFSAWEAKTEAKTETSFDIKSWKTFFRKTVETTVIKFPPRDTGGNEMTFNSKEDFVAWIKEKETALSASIKLEAKARLEAKANWGKVIWKREKQQTRKEIVQEAITLFETETPEDKVVKPQELTEEEKPVKKTRKKRTTNKSASKKKK